MSNARDEIAALIYGYAEKLDAGDLAGMAAYFEHATYGPGGGPSIQGAETLEALLNQIVMMYDGTPRTKHVTTNLVIDVDKDGDTASARSYFSVFQAVEGMPLQPIIMGRYRDQFKRGPSGWYFTDRQIFMDLVGDLSRHLRSGPVES
jgi:ketosteroid isomerase-like protein